ncbi:MAG: MBL fold metallo-hydrolase [Rhodobacterales bacterium]|nr:MBL fold metallo-hydrolase [Rhodobacterales bacterium]
MAFRLRFRGVRGSIAVPSPDHVRYGGNTSCIEVALGDHRLVLDAGTGIRELGQDLLRENVRDVNILLTHTHWDHINGFPFFAPAYLPENRVRIYAGHLTGEENALAAVLSTQMANPMFPVPLEAMQADLTLVDFRAGETLHLFPDVEIPTAPLNHPNGATGYRINYDGRSLCYITDTEHKPGGPDQRILELIKGADLVIYDSTYTQEEYKNHVGWGHSTWNEGVRLCRAADVKRMAIFHHEPDHDDAFMDALAAEAAAVWDGAFVAQEGMVIDMDDL